jgi:hypothetical protein
VALIIDVAGIVRVSQKDPIDTNLIITTENDVAA